VVFSSDSVRERETRSASAEFLSGFAQSEVVVESFRNGYFPSSLSEIKDRFERLKRELRPDLIFTHSRDDLHQDHRILAELTWNTFRDHLILEYEILKYDGDLANPSAYVAVDDDTVQRKIDILLRSYASQRDKRWFTEDAFRALLRIRGIHGASPTGWAEAYSVRKMMVDF
jgi:LmbE family N-acetylglucosaminyl deacetylase